MTDFQVKQQYYKQVVLQLKNKFTQILNCGNNDYRNQFINFATMSINQCKSNFNTSNQNHQVLANIHNIFRFEYKNGRCFPTNQFDDLLTLYPDDPELINYLISLCNYK